MSSLHRARLSANESVLSPSPGRSREKKKGQWPHTKEYARLDCIGAGPWPGLTQIISTKCTRTDTQPRDVEWLIWKIRSWHVFVWCPFSVFRFVSTQKQIYESHLAAEAVERKQASSMFLSLNIYVLRSLPTLDDGLAM